MKRYSGSVKLSQSIGEAGNRRPSVGQSEKVRGRYLMHNPGFLSSVLLESVRLLWDSAPRGGGFVSPSLSSSLPPSAWSKETLSRALLKRCISNSPCGDEKLRAAMVERARAFCLLRDSSPPSRRPFWLCNTKSRTPILFFFAATYV